MKMNKLKQFIINILQSITYKTEIHQPHFEVEARVPEKPANLHTQFCS